jgi:DNA-binding GntR family transcriptional regulator
MSPQAADSDVMNRTRAKAAKTGNRRRRSGATGLLASHIQEQIHLQKTPPGTHLSAEHIAKSFNTSRTPIIMALNLLAKQKVVLHKPNRGFFVGATSKLRTALPGEKSGNGIDKAYFALAQDRLEERLPVNVTETFIKKRYKLTTSQVDALLQRVAQEGWIERRGGYGWTFSEILTTPEALAQTFRLRRTLEPASLLEPGYRLDPKVIEECRRIELDIRDGDVETLSLEQLFARGARFHEAIVAGSGNAFFLDAIRRVNKIRRLLSYKAMGDRQRYKRQCEEHLIILDLIEAGKLKQASDYLQAHLERAEKHYSKLTR